MLFHFYQRKINFTLDLKINNISISKTEVFDFLGLQVHENLNWNAHISKIGNKLSKVIGILKRLNKYIPTTVLLLIYNSLFLSHLNYSILTWGFSCKHIFALQKKAVRLICCAKFNAHTDPLFKKLSILKVQDIFQLRAIKFYFRYVQNQLPAYFHDLYAVTSRTHSYSTRGRENAPLPRPNKITSEQCIRYYIPSMIKILPSYITDKVYTHSYSGLSSYTKMYFIKQYQDVCTVPSCFVCNN